MYKNKAAELTCVFYSPCCRLKGHDHVLENAHTYTPNDLYEANDGILTDLLDKVVTFGTKHVRSCELCSMKGFVCELCTKNEVRPAKTSDYNSAHTFIFPTEGVIWYG